LSLGVAAESSWTGICIPCIVEITFESRELDNSVKDFSERLLKT